MNLWLAVALGGALGSVARYALKVALGSGGGFPWSTLGVNVLGSLFIGLLAGWGREAPEALRLGLLVGVLGGFTTFSAFSLETLNLLREQPVLALLNVVTNLTLGLMACALGLWLAARTGSV